jgi:hypothetical protein
MCLASYLRWLAAGAFCVSKQSDANNGEGKHLEDSADPEAESESSYPRTSPSVQGQARKHFQQAGRCRICSARQRRL